MKIQATAVMALLLSTSSVQGSRLRSAAPSTIPSIAPSSTASTNSTEAPSTASTNSTEAPFEWFGPDYSLRAFKVASCYIWTSVIILFLGNIYLFLTTPKDPCDTGGLDFEKPWRTRFEDTMEKYDFEEEEMGWFEWFVYMLFSTSSDDYLDTAKEDSNVADAEVDSIELGSIPKADMDVEDDGEFYDIDLGEP